MSLRITDPRLVYYKIVSYSVLHSSDVETKHRSYSHPVGFGGPINLIHIEIDRKLFKKCLLWWHFPPGVGIPGLNWNPDPGIWENKKTNEFKSFDPIKSWKIGMEMLGFNQVPGFCFWHLHVVPVCPLSLNIRTLMILSTSQYSQDCDVHRFPSNPSEGLGQGKRDCLHLQWCALANPTTNHLCCKDFAEITDKNLLSPDARGVSLRKMRESKAKTSEVWQNMIYHLFYEVHKCTQSVCKSRLKCTQSR